MRVNVFSYMLWAVCAAVVDVSNHFRSSVRLRQVSVVLVFLLSRAPCVSVLLLLLLFPV